MCTFFMFLDMMVLSVLALDRAACGRTQDMPSVHSRTEAGSAQQCKTLHLCVCSPQELDAKERDLCRVAKDELCVSATHRHLF
jgi:hypothetical protein